ncbi:hypothetical protein IPH19_01245 [Candidatus Uhrbacteria bacterium]|nr:MAG: hypothetical protein IPH19_01245 [Candidatus Uhrbacteria bacterium]
MSLMIELTNGSRAKISPATNIDLEQVLAVIRIFLNLGNTAMLELGSSCESDGCEPILGHHQTIAIWYRFHELRIDLRVRSWERPIDSEGACKRLDFMRVTYGPETRPQVYRDQKPAALELLSKQLFLKSSRSPS